MKDLLEWWCAIYWVPLSLALIFLLMSAVSSGGDEGDGDSGADATGDDAGDDGGDDGDDGGEGWGGRILGLLGVGRIPLTLALSLYLLFWGTFGLIANRLCLNAGLPVALFVGPVLMMNFLATVLVTGVAARLLGRILPPMETFAIRDDDLIGCEGAAVYPVTEKTGTVQITDQYGTVHRRQARTESGDAAIAANSRVLVTGIAETQSRLIVKPYDQQTA